MKLIVLTEPVSVINEINLRQMGRGLVLGGALAAGAIGCGRTGQSTPAQPQQAQTQQVQPTKSQDQIVAQGRSPYGEWELKTNQPGTYVYYVSAEKISRNPTIRNGQLSQINFLATQAFMNATGSNMRGVSHGMPKEVKGYIGIWFRINDQGSQDQSRASGQQSQQSGQSQQSHQHISPGPSGRVMNDADL